MNNKNNIAPSRFLPGALTNALATNAGKEALKSMGGEVAKKGLGGILGKAAGSILGKNPLTMGLGAVAGGLGGFLDARQEARAAGEKLTFRGAIDDVLLGAGKGALNPLQGGIGLVKEGIETRDQNKMINANIANSGDAMQNASLNQYPVFDPLSAATMKSLFVK